MMPSLGLASLQVQRQQLFQNLIIGQITLLAIGGEDGIVEAFVRQTHTSDTYRVGLWSVSASDYWVGFAYL